jgi:cardiolipin synthase
LQVLYANHRVELLEGGTQYFPALVQAMQQSQQEIRLETYIFEFDVAGKQVAAALESAAQRGVSVSLVMDGIGTPVVPQEWQQRWNAAGVEWQRFSPLGTLGLLMPSSWRRMHRKLCVVDAKVAFCGGINILDDFYDPSFGVLDLARFDFAVQVWGPLVQDVHQTMGQFWRRLQATRQLEKGQFRAAHRAMQKDSALPNALAQAPILLEPLEGKTAGVSAKFVVRDNVAHRNRIEQTYRHALAHARKEVLIANAYFLPGRKLRRALVHAAKRGVRVRLLLQGRYEYFMQYHAVKPVYNALLAAGVEIYEYEAGFLHAKVAVIDSFWATVGSSNLDPLSLLLAREANVVVQNAAFAQGLQARLETAIVQHCKPIRQDDGQRRSLLQKTLDHLAYWLLRLSLLLTGFRY